MGAPSTSETPRPRSSFVSGLRDALRALATTYAIATGGMLLTFVITPIYLRTLGLEQMGLLAIGQLIAGYLTLSNGGFRASTVILVSHAKGDDDWSGIATLMRSSVLLSIVASWVVGLVSFGLALSVVRFPAVGKLLGFVHPDVPALIGVVGLRVVVTLLSSCFFDLLSGLQENQRVSVMQGVLRIVSQVAGGVVAFVYPTASAVIGASVVVTVVAGVVCGVQTYRRHPKAFQLGPIERATLVRQVRTGLKSFGILVGATIGGYAPVAVINHAAGAASVPMFTIPYSIMFPVAGVIGSFGGLMLPIFGQAWAKRDIASIQTTVPQMLERILLLLGAASAGFLALGAPFIAAWVKLDISFTMLLSVVVISCSVNIIAYLKFMLSGINRHRVAAVSELLNGGLILVFAAIASRMSIDLVGIGVGVAGAVTSFWLLPREIKKHVGITRLLPGPLRLLTAAGIIVLVYASARGSLFLLHELPQIPSIVSVFAAAAIGGGAFLYASAVTGLFDWRSVARRMR